MSRASEPPKWGLCPEPHGDRCARDAGDGRRCVCNCHGPHPHGGPGRFVATDDRAIPLDTVTHTPRRR